MSFEVSAEYAERFLWAGGHLTLAEFIGLDAAAEVVFVEAGAKVHAERVEALIAAVMEVVDAADDALKLKALADKAERLVG